MKASEGWYPVMVAASLIWSTTDRARRNGWPEPAKPAKRWWPFVALAKSIDLRPHQLCSDDPGFDQRHFDRACLLFARAWEEAGRPPMAGESLAIVAQPRGVSAA